MIDNFLILFKLVGDVFDLFVDVFDFEDIATTSVVQSEFFESQNLKV